MEQTVSDPGGPLSQRGILLHHASLPAALDPAVEAEWLRALPAALVARLGAMREPRDRAATLVGLALLADCARAAGIDPPVLASLDYAPRRKPCWPGGPDFSISHDSARAACALAPAGQHVGLDIESKDAVPESGLRLIAGDTELAEHRAAGLSATDLWAAKEAVVKVFGAGIGEAAQVRAGPRGARHGPRRYVIARPTLAPDCVAAVAACCAFRLILRERDAVALLAAGP